MPQTDFREKTGRFYNEMNNASDSPKVTQEKLNFIADSIGQQPTREALLTPTGILYILSILQNFELPPEGGPRRENAVQDTDAVFEANTVVQTKRKGEQVSIDSFLSSSTVNTTRISQPASLNRTKRSDTIQESTPGSSEHVHFLAHEVHGLSLELHKLAYDIKELSNCTTEKETFQLGETIEKTHFNTICQNATAKSNQVNKQDLIQSEEVKHFSFDSSSGKKKGAADPFSSEEAAQILRNNFQAFFEKEYEQRPHANDNVTTQRASFWEELNETFSSFFSQFERTTYTEPQAGTSGSSIMESFLSMMMQTFSVHHENQESLSQRTKHDVSWFLGAHASNNSSTIKSSKSNPSKSTSNPSTSKQNEFVLKQEEAAFLTKLSHLTSEFATTLDGFVERMFSPFLSAEAKSLSEPSTLTDATSPDEQVDRTASPTIAPETNQVHEINETIVNDRIPSVRYQEPLPIFFYNHALFQRKNGTRDVNKKLKEFFIKEKMANGATTDVELLDIAQKWIGNKELDKLERKHFLTYIILENYGIENVRWGEFISAGKLQDIFLQWKTNTLLEDYTYKDITSETAQYDLSKTDPAFIHSFNEYKQESDCVFNEFMKGTPNTIPNTQLLSPIYHQDSLFQARGRTEVVNEKVWDFLVKQKFLKDLASSRELVQKVQEWIFLGENYAGIIERQRQVAELICQAYGITTANMSPAMARLYLLQWEDNNAQVGYSFEEKKDGFTTAVAIETENLEKKITDFMRENHIKIPQRKKQLLPDLDKKQKEDQRIKIASLLTNDGVPCACNDPQQVIQGITQWLLGINSESVQTIELDENISKPLNSLGSGETSPEVLYAGKIKKLANVLLEKKEGTEISEELANEIVCEWLTSATKEDDTLLHEFVAKEGFISRNATSVWQSPKLLSEIEAFLRQENVLPSGKAIKETVLLAAGKWLMPEDNKSVFHKENLQKFVKVITKELNFYGRKGEEISDNVAEMMVKKWVLENVLGGSFEEYLAKRMMEVSDPSKFTVSDLEDEIASMLTKFNYRIPLDQYRDQAIEQEHNFVLLWKNLVRTSLPIDIDFLNKKELISHSGLLPLLIGGKLLESLGNQHDINESQKRSLGAAFMDSIAEKNQLEFSDIQAIFPSALLATAQLEPDSLRKALLKGDYKEFVLNTFVSYCKTGYFKIVEEQNTIDTLFQSYQNTILNWRGKGAIAKEVIQTCYAAGATLVGELPIQPFGRPPFHKVSSEEAIDYYLSGENPCPTLNRPLPILEEKYKKLTNDVAHSYSQLDKKIIELTLNAMDPTDSQFIFSKATQIYEASAIIQKEFATFQAYPAWKNLALKGVDLFMAKQGTEERVYGLKKLGSEQGYSVYRVDKDPELYNKYNFFSEKYVRTRDRLEVSVDKDSQRFSNMDGQSDSVQSIFASILSSKHRNDLYNRLYKEGDEKTRREKGIEFLLGFVPFYDCVTGIIENDLEKAIPSCVIDVVLLIPVVGKAIALTTKFGLGVARQLLKSGVKGLVKNSKYFLPTRAESLKLGISMVRYIDPGIESVSDVSKLLAKLMKLRFKSQSKEINNLIKTLEKLQKEPSVASESIVMARLPNGGPEVPVKRVDEHLYVQVMNPQGDPFGEYFLLKNNQLELFKGPVKFSKEQKKMINRIEVKLNEKQNFDDLINLNPHAYGEGSVRSVFEEAKVTKEWIQLNNRWVPVKQTGIPGHGIRYDIEYEGVLHPINFNGAEWYFEAATSPFITKKIERKIGKKLGQFETAPDPNVLSAPDERGLVRDASGRSYIKIKNHYVPLVLVDEGANRYHLVKKNVNRPMTILKFHPESNQFRVETLLEKKVREAELKAEYTEFEINHYRTEEVPQPGGSQPDGSQPGPSHRVQLPQLDLRARLKLVTLPVVPNRSAMWNAVRQATIRPQANDLPQLDPVMIERALTQRDLTVQPHRLTTFIPPKPVEVVPSSLQNEFDIRDSMIMNEFDEIFTPYPHGPKLNYEVMKGVDIRNSPDFIKPFQLELKRGLEKGHHTFSCLKEQCQYLSTIPDISATREGQYLAKMFMIEHAVDKNQILHTINQRLLAIAERGELILKTTKDIGFENIWIASTNLIFNPATSKYETQLVKNKRTYAFTMEGDPQARMVFIADSFHSPPHPVLERKQDPFKVVLHETTHLGADMADLVLYPLPQKGFEISGRELLDAYHENFPQIINSKAFNDFVDRLAVEQNLPSLSSEAVLTALYFDDMLRVNLQMEDAEMIAVIFRDLYEGRSFDLKKRVARSADERSLGDQLATIFQNYALSSIFNIDQYHLSPHLDKRQEQEKTKKSTDAPEKIEVEKEQDKSTADVKREVEKKSILNVIATGIEKSNGRRSTNRKSANIGELAIN